MAFLQCNIRPESLGNATTINVIFPQRLERKAYPTLYLLHGYSDDHTAWQRQTAIERYANQYQLAVVMPDVQRSFYCDYQGFNNKSQYWRYVSRELIAITRNMFYLSEKREDTYVAGLSMGGFGAFKLGLNCPETFAAAASLSGALDMGSRAQNWENRAEINLYFGKRDEFPGSINDLLSLAQKTNALAVKPRLYQYCGTEDFLYAENQHFREVAQSLTFDYTYVEGSGDHQWAYWDAQIQNVLAWLALERA